MNLSECGACNHPKWYFFQKKTLEHFLSNPFFVLDVFLKHIVITFLSFYLNGFCILSSFVYLFIYFSSFCRNHCTIFSYQICLLTWIYLSLYLPVVSVIYCGRYIFAHCSLFYFRNPKLVKCTFVYIYFNMGPIF